IKNQILQTFYSVLEREDELWFGTDKGRIWRYAAQSQTFELYQTGAGSAVTHLIEGRAGAVVIGTAGDGIRIYDAVEGETRPAGEGTGQEYVLSLWRDPYENIWIQTQAPGISRLDPYTRRIVHYRAEPMQGSEHISSVGFIRIDPENRVWIKLRQGLFHLYDPQEKTLTPFHQTPFAPSGDYPSAVTNVFFDRQSNLWICSLKGVDKITFSKHNFQLLPLADSHATGENDVRAMLEDRQGNTWIATKEPKIHLFAPDETYRGYLCADGSVGCGVPFQGKTYCLYADETGTVWAGTKGDGLYRFSPRCQPVRRSRLPKRSR
ncbi:MAG: hypothetical protein LUD68_06285, partial [Rikenellaceae bacterium]|nr:hypothetical protein [Rikenellaceae bacterium]